MAKILIVNTGGTIAMSENHETGAVAPTEMNPLDSLGAYFHSIADIEIVDLFYLPSPHMTENEMLVLSHFVEDQAEDFDGIIVTHGTDTLEETAYFLDLTTHLSIPVVVTGAMRSSNEIGSDGLANLRSSIIVATDPTSRDKGVLVVMNDEVHSAALVTKTHTTNVATFQTPTYGPLGLVSKRDVIYFQTRPRSPHYQVQQVQKKVYLLKAYAGMDESLVEAIHKMGADGLVIEALGAGNLPPRMKSSVLRCIEDRIPVVFVSRAFNGITQDVYDYEGGGKQFKKAGVLFTNGLNGQKARIKLACMLDSGISFEEIAKFFS